MSNAFKNSDLLNGSGITSVTGTRQPWYASATSAPASTASEGSITTAFNGDLSKCQFPVEHRITGATTAGQPTTGYLYTHEIYPHYTYLYNTSGWNQNTNSNVGRTAVCAYRTKVDNYGQGDAMAYNATAFVTGTKAGSTNFLANPAVALFAGDMNAGADGVYLNLYETIASDYGYDVACVGIVNNFVRTKATGAKSTIWNGYRAQSQGSATCDSVISGTGKWVVGIDFAMSTTDFGANLAAISLRSGQRIYLNNAATASGNLEANYRTTVFNGDYISYSTGINGIAITTGGTNALQIVSTQVTVNTANGLAFASTGVLRFSGTSQYGTGASTAVFAPTNKPGATSGAGPAQWLSVILGGSTFLIPCWAQ